MTVFSAPPPEPGRGKAGSIKALEERTGSAPTTLSIGLTLVAVLPLVGAWIPGPVAWGLNHLAYLPLWFRAVWGALSVLLLLPITQRRLAAWMGESLPAALFTGSRGALVFLLLFAALFVLLRERSFFMGDGYLIGELVDRGMPFRAFDNLDYVLHFRAWVALRGKTPLDSFGLYRATAVVAGVLGLGLWILLIRRLPWEGWRRVLLLGFLVTSGPVAMFFGYVESYAFLHVFLTGYVLTGLLVLAGRAPLWAASTFLGLGLAFHLTAPASGLGLLVLALRAPVRPAARRWLEVVGPPLLLFAASVLIHLALGYDRGFFEKEFLENKNTRSILLPLTGGRGFFSAYHWKDLVNLALVTAPACLVVLTVRSRILAGRRTDPSVQFLAAQMAGVCLAALIVDRKLGGARDWDLLAAHVSGLLCLAALLLPAAEEGGEGRRTARAPREAALALVAGFLIAGPWIVLLNQEPRSISRFVDVAGDFPNFARAYAYEEVGKYYRKREDYTRAEEMYERCVQAYPSNPRFLLLLGSIYFIRGNLDDAERVYRQALGIDPRHKMALEMLGKVLFQKGEQSPPGATQAGLYAEAVQNFVTLTELAPLAADNWQFLAMAAGRAGQFAVAERAYRRALQIKPTNELRHGLGTTLFAQGRLADAATAYKDALARGERGVATRAGLALCLVGAAEEVVRSGGVPDPASLAEAEQLCRGLLAENATQGNPAELLTRLDLLRRGRSGPP